MDDEPTFKIYEPWLLEWAAFGISELEDYLGKQARFEEYDERRNREQHG